MPTPRLPKKLIETALPLDAINAAAAREKSIRHGHPSTLHLWWARRPLAAARAVLFAQLVNDPGWKEEHDAATLGLSNDPEARRSRRRRAEKKRAELFGLLEDLVLWENTTNEAVLDRARRAIRESWAETCKITGEDPRQMPPLHDPFAGGGAIPLEAQRLGLDARASDLNPVAVLINKAMIEIPPRFAGRSPVGPIPEGERGLPFGHPWPGASGLAEDVRRYGAWMRREAERRIGHLYPTVRLPKTHGGGEATVIAWLWARTVASPNPAMGGAHVPLVSSFWLSTKAGKEAYVEPVVDGTAYRFEIRHGKPADPEAVAAGTKLGRGAAFRCVLSGATISGDYVKAEGKAGRMGARLMAIVAEGNRSRIYLAPTDEHEAAAAQAEPTWAPTGEVPSRLTGGTCYAYGLTEWGDLFTRRQLVALTTFSDLVAEARALATKDAQRHAFPDDERPLADGGTGAVAYGEAIQTYLGMGVGRASDAWSSLVGWRPQVDATRNTFARQAIPMVWDFAEANPFSDSCGNWTGNSTEWVRKAIEAFPADGIGSAKQQAAQASGEDVRIFSTDPPYYDNIGYADLSDFFYVWLRRSLRPVYPDLFAPMLVPKAEELVATPYRHGGKAEAERFFLDGMTDVMHRMAEATHPAFPVTIYYAFKQSDTGSDGTGSTGWETFLEAVIRAGFAIVGTWPMRTEREGKITWGNNVLASSIILVCRPRGASAQAVTQREFLSALEHDLPEALDVMMGGEAGRTAIAPVDLSQAVIGPGIGLYSRHAEVLKATGERMTVREALQHVNRVADDYVTGLGANVDAETRFAYEWFVQHGFDAGLFGSADTLARAKNTSVSGVAESGIAEAKDGKVRLYRAADYAADWDPARDARIPVWEVLHQLVRALGAGGVDAAGAILAQLPEKAEATKALAYRMYTLCERTGRAQDAQAYNGLVASWPLLVKAAAERPTKGAQGEIFEG